MLRTVHFCLMTAGVFLAFGEAVAAGPAAKKRPEMAISKAFLKDRGLPTDDEGMLNTLRKFCIKDVAISDLIRQLGDANPKLREEAAARLMKLEHLALPGLREAINSDSLERAKRAELCLRTLESRCHGYYFATLVNVLRQRKPEGVFEVFLNFLPLSNDPVVEESIYRALDEVIEETRTVPACLIAALDDPLPARRAIAGCILARRGDEATRRKVKKLLKDTSPNVRLRTSQGLLADQKSDPIPVLIDLLATPDIQIAWQAEELLFAVANDSSPAGTIGHGPRGKIADVQAAWKKWEISFREHEKTGRTIGKAKPKLGLSYRYDGKDTVFVLSGSAEPERFVRRVALPGKLREWENSGLVVTTHGAADFGIHFLDLEGNEKKRIGLPQPAAAVKVCPTGALFAVHRTPWCSEYSASGTVLSSKRVDSILGAARVLSFARDCRLFSKEVQGDDLLLQEISVISGKATTKMLLRTGLTRVTFQPSSMPLPDDSFLVPLQCYDTGGQFHYLHFDCNGLLTRKHDYASAKAEFPWEAFVQPLKAFKLIEFGFR